jgi:hypothetical protein
MKTIMSTVMVWMLFLTIAHSQVATANVPNGDGTTTTIICNTAGCVDHDNSVAETRKQVKDQHRYCKKAGIPFSTRSVTDDEACKDAYIQHLKYLVAGKGVEK